MDEITSRVKKDLWRSLFWMAASLAIAWIIRSFLM